jgi:hypothetical protein
LHSEREYLNHGLSITERDEYAFRLITDKKWRDQERYCRNNCWFDYRFLHPFDATMVYIEAFNTVYRDLYKAYRNFKTADVIRVVKPDDMIHALEKNRTAIVGCWRGRMLADQFGMPYQAYIKDAMEIRLKYWNQKHLPRPPALYHQMIIDQMEGCWKRRQEARMHFSTHPNFLTERYIGSPAQNDHHEWLFEQAKLRSNPEDQVREFVKKGLLPVEKARARYGETLTFH